MNTHTHFCSVYTQELNSWVRGQYGNAQVQWIWQFPKVVVINYILTTNESEFQLLHSPVNIWYWKSFFFLVLVGVQGYQIIVLIHISLMTNVVEHFSSVHWSLIYHLSLKCLSFLLIFLFDFSLLFIFLVDKSSIYNSRCYSLEGYMIYDIFSQINLFYRPWLLWIKKSISCVMDSR